MIADESLSGPAPLTLDPSGRMNEYERNLLRHIDEYGCSATSVFDPDGGDPPFSYSIGIAKSCGAPELVLIRKQRFRRLNRRVRRLSAAAICL